MTTNTETPYRSVWMCLNDLPFTQGFVDADGIRTRYIQAGPSDAPAVIFLHGTGASWECCCANIRPHAEHFNTLAIDMVGTGFSTKPDKLYTLDVYVEHLRAFMDAKGLKQASIVGVSLGSFVAAKFAQKYPERTDKITMVSAVGLPFKHNPNMSEEEQGQHMLDAARKRRRAQVENPSWEAMKTLLSRLILKPENVVDDLVGVRQSVYRQPGMAEAMEHIMDLYAPEVFNRDAIQPEQWRQIQTPVLITLSVDSKDWFYETAQEIHRLLPHSQMLKCPGASHWPQWECADAFNRANIAFLQQA